MIEMNIKPAIDRDSLMDSGFNQVHPAYSMDNIEKLNRDRVRLAREQQGRRPSYDGTPLRPASPARPAPPPAPARPAAPPVQARPAAAPVRPAPPPHPVPWLVNQVQKGQKVPVGDGGVRRLKAGFGWSSRNASCDVDVSAFMLGENGKVPGDEWIVFYGQPDSPDGSTCFREETGEDLQSIAIDLGRLSPAVTKIVFVLTIHEAAEQSLHFGMLYDAYVRIFDAERNAQLTSFRMTDYDAGMISMMIGELYFYKGAWKFSAVGNGKTLDLAGLCEWYGVQVID